MWSFINKRNFDKGKNCGFTLSKAWRMTPVPAWVLAGGSAVWKILQYSIKPEKLNEAELRDIVTFAYTSAGLSNTKNGGISSVPEYGDVLARLGRQWRIPSAYNLTTNSVSSKKLTEFCMIRRIRKNQSLNSGVDR